MSTETQQTPSELKRLPLEQKHIDAGARMMPFAGWNMPLQYEGIVAEHEAVRQRAGMFDVSHMGRVWVRGSGAAHQIRAVSTYDTSRIPLGGTHYSLYCNEDGGIEDDVFIFHVGDDRWFVVHNAGNAEPDAARLAAATDGTAEDVGRETVMLAVQGPEAVAAVSRVLGPAIDQLKPRTCTEIEYNGETLLLSRTGYTGEDGAEIVMTPATGAALWDAFVDAGVTPAGLGCRDTLRLEAALPLHGNDIWPETTPYQARIGWAVTLEDGAAFTGRDALESESATPPKRRLAHLKLLDRGVPRPGYSVRDHEDTEIGTLTSGAFSPTLRTGIAMGYLPREYTDIGTRLAIEVRGQRIPAEVVRRPFYRRQQPDQESA